MNLTVKRLPSLLALLLSVGGVYLHAYELDKKFRRPVALALTENGMLAVGNRDSGSVSLINLPQREVIFEIDVGLGVSDLRTIPGEPYLVATDEEASELILLETKGRAGQLIVRRRVPTPHSPVGVEVAKSGAFMTVTSLWSRRVSLFRFDRIGELCGGSVSPISLSHLVCSGWTTRGKDWSFVTLSPTKSPY